MFLNIHIITSIVTCKIFDLTCGLLMSTINKFYIMCTLIKTQTNEQTKRKK